MTLMKVSQLVNLCKPLISKLEVSYTSQQGTPPDAFYVELALLRQLDLACETVQLVFDGVDVQIGIDLDDVKRYDQLVKVISEQLHHRGTNRGLVSLVFDIPNDNQDFNFIIGVQLQTLDQIVQIELVCGAELFDVDQDELIVHQHSQIVDFLIDHRFAGFDPKEKPLPVGAVGACSVAADEAAEGVAPKLKEGNGVVDGLPKAEVWAPNPEPLDATWPNKPPMLLLAVAVVVEPNKPEPVSFKDKPVLVLALNSGITPTSMSKFDSPELTSS
ncbi:hypothetical protein WICPIJ_006031 [Wickerhamomyces pijperi]|uniref:Uncharacterized protein n=1 Tax=Wickerhamomyces pijperi TaxID=599730 RepID=A0A9P8TL93_WICPI|nr:hypothetical protein WICPIJ_006031 [Wickerhamomyces pijperi]